MRISHIILRVADLDRSIAFYRDSLGFTVIGGSPAFTFIDAGNLRIALNATETPSSDTSLTEIVLEVDDITAAHAAMAGRGVSFRVPPRAVTTEGDRSLHATDFTDPDGHLLSLTGWVDD